MDQFAGVADPPGHLSLYCGLMLLWVQLARAAVPSGSFYSICIVGFVDQFAGWLLHQVTYHCIVG